MLRKLWDILAIVAVANLLIGGTALLALAAGGGLTANKLAMIRDVIQGRALPTAKPEKAAPEAEPAVLSTAGQLIAGEQSRTQVLGLQIDQQMRELRDFQVQLDQARAALDGRIAQFEQDKKAWLAQRAAEQALLAGEGFQKSLGLYESLPADQAKDLFMAMTDEEVVRLLSAMEPRKAAKVAKAFQTDAEKARLKKVLDRLEKPPTLGEASGQAPAGTEEKVSGALRP